MTTNIGVKAFDPNYKENYVLLVADSQGTWKDEGLERSAYNQKKIYLNKGKNFMFASAGTTNNFIFEYKSILKSKEVINSEKLIKTFSNINKQNFNDNTYICAQNQNGIVSFFTLFENRLVEAEYLCNGSGKKFIQKSMDEILEFSRWMNRERIIVCPLKEVISFCFNVLQKASKKDKYTGGHMDIGIMTSKASIICYNFESLRDKETKELKRKNIESLFN